MAAAMGAQAQLGMAASGAATEKYEYMEESVALTEEFLDQEGIIGTRSHMSERVVQNIRRVSGTVRMRPNSVELDALLPRILGTAEAADVFALAETTPTFDLTVDRVTKVFSYTSCVVARAVFRCSQGQPLELEMQIEGLDETVGNAGTFPALSVSTIGPYIFSECVMVINAQTLKWRDFTLTVDNMVDTERFFNSNTRQSIPARDRLITWSLNGPYGDNSAIYGSAAAQVYSGVACTATFTKGARSLLFSSTKVAAPRRSPVAPTKDEIMLSFDGVARKDGSTLELVTTNDSAP